ncbi:MAG: hypothetical protein HZA54_15350 [Planctomycetes bacterium]|nr:hypothetical protein [Planctomycetota bacterium]
MISLVWFLFPICLVAGLVLAGAREEDPKRILVRGVHTFIVLCLLVGGLCCVMWLIQAYQPNRRLFFAGAGVLIAAIYGASALFEGKNAVRLARLILGLLAALGLHTPPPRPEVGGAGSGAGAGGAGGAAGTTGGAGTPPIVR